MPLNVSFLLGKVFCCNKDINICLINILMNISTQSLRDYLECANIYKGNASKKKTDLVEVIVYGRITDKLNKIGVEDISSKQANQILNKKRYNNKIITRIWKC